MKILHFAKDEKVIPLQQDLFEEAFPGANTWLIQGKSGKPFQHVVLNHNTKQVLPSYFKSKTLKRDSEAFDLLIVHAMDRVHADGVKSVCPGICTIWLGWGYDYYFLLADQIGGIYLDKTEIFRKKLFKAKLKSFFHKLTPTLTLVYFKRAISKSLNYTGFIKYNSLKTVTKRIDVYHVIESEVEMLKKALPNLNADYCKHYYYTVEDVYDKGPPKMAGPHILLGNSASLTNNHCEAFDFLRKISQKERKIIVPLNYGDSLYADEICKIGKNQLGNAFIPLREWLPIDEYNQKISRCGFVIMNHKRQRAFGNINIALYKGAKVFLRSENPLYAYYLSIGVKIYSVENLKQSAENALKPLGSVARENNHKIIGDYMCRKKVVSHIQEMERFVKKNMGSPNRHIKS